MIITCASCLTKFNLDDSRISAEGVKVRCSRCKHVFYVVPPPETKEEIIENFESFAKFHEDLMEPGEVRTEVSTESKVKEEVVLPKETEEALPFSEEAPTENVEQWVPPGEVEELASREKIEKLLPEESIREERVEGRPSRPKSMMHVDRRGPFRFLALLIVLMLLIFGIFFLWSELSSGGRLSSYLGYPVKKITELWNQVWGIEEGGLIVGDLTGYQEKIGEVPLFIIEGKVKNQSKFTKKYIKIRVIIFDEDKLKVAEKDAVCGRVIARGELKKQPAEFFGGEMVIKPQTEQEMITPSGKETPFMVIFRDLPSKAKDFKYEILEAPNL
jgi:predicted Zn finger-like uncharacterized protein